MTPKERFLAALSLKETDEPVVGCVTQSVTVDQEDWAGVEWPAAHNDAQMMAKLGIAGAKVFGFDNARVPFCLTVEAEALGAHVDLGTRVKTPMIKEHPFESSEGVVIPDNFLTTGRVATAIEAVKILKAEYGNEYPIVVGTTGPLTMAGHLVGTENLLFMTLTDADEVHKLIKITTEAEKMYTKALVDAGADVVNMSDPSSSTDMLSAEMFDEFAKPYTKEVFDNIGDSAKKILHICGNTTTLLEHMVSTGADGLSIEEKVDSAEAVSIVDGRCALVGNLGSVKPLFMGTPEECAADAKRIKEAGFNIIAPGCGLAAETPRANIEAFVKAVKGGNHPFQTLSL